MRRVATEMVTLIRDYVNEIKGKSDNAPFTKLWAFGVSSPRLKVEMEEWEMLLDMVDPKSPLILASYNNTVVRSNTDKM